MIFSFICVALLSTAPVSGRDFQLVRATDTTIVDLIYPSQTVNLNGYVEIGVKFPANMPNMYGAFFWVRQAVVDEQGSDKFVELWGNPPADGIKSQCHIYPPRLDLVVTRGPFDKAGVYGIYWNFMWGWPEYVDPNDPSRCSGNLTSTELYQARASFVVVEDNSSPTVTVLGTSTRSDIAGTPSGSVYLRLASDSHLRHRFRIAPFIGVSSLIYLLFL